MKSKKIKIGGTIALILTIITTIFGKDIRDIFIQDPVDKKKDPIVIVLKNEQNNEEKSKSKVTKIINQAENTSTETLHNIIAVKHQNQPNINDIAIVIINSKKSNLKISNKIADIYRKNSNTTPITNLLNNTFSDKYFDLFYYGGGSSNFNLNLNQYADQLLLGEVNSTEKLNDRNMSTVRLNLKINLYDTQTYSLIDSFSAKGKGLGFDSNSANQDAYNQLYENIAKHISK